ncbi:hypothetical protein EST38_g10179 [Candolleomyces aberdarensis]|uniref:Uncharacterized protein n=1 Tax=Candolleomyces aberdarensis TaxID=2316362 RepID=A0A4Q2DAI0_9AGAR|nr:hypothetical protein EST38_g10179 [Candolleomyces aberdarensis]
MENNTGHYAIRDENRTDLKHRGTANSTTSLSQEEKIDPKEDTIVRTSASPDADPSHPPHSSTPLHRRRRLLYDICLLLAILFMVVWPWVFYGVVSAKQGIQMSQGLSEYVLANPQQVTAVVTLLGTFNRIIATFLFGCAIVRYGQEWISIKEDRITVFGMSALLAFRHMSFMWGIGEWWALFRRGRRLVILALLLFSLGGFALIPSGTAGLLAPGQYNKTSVVTGREMDFTTEDSECLAWIENLGSLARCDWVSTRNVTRLTCLSEAQIIEAFSAGRNNGLTLSPNDSLALTPRQVTVDEPVQVLGSVRGVLPIRPIGFRGFGLDQWTDAPLQNAYSYTLHQQGLDSNIRCTQSEYSPIQYRAIDNINTTRIIATSGVCDAGQGLENAMPLVIDFVTLNTQSTLTFWASKNTSHTVDSEGPAFYLYFRGRTGYAGSIGNITCALSPFRSGDYAVTYHSSGRYFSAERAVATQTARETHLLFLTNVVTQFGTLVWNSQMWSGHPLGASLSELGVKLLDLPPSSGPDARLLSLLEAMSQGILDFIATSTRLFYSISPDFPDSCQREVNGVITYSVVGWYPATGYAQVGLLIPMTLMNLASLAVCAMALKMGQLRYRYNFDPTDTRSLLAATADRGGPKEAGWEDRVTF